MSMSISTLTSVHVVLSLVGIASGVAALLEPVGSRRAVVATLFLATTIATSVTGFLFPGTHVGTGQIVGAVSLVVLVPTTLAFCRRELAGAWRWIYSGGAAIALYLNAFIGVQQAFKKVDFLRPLAPTASAPAFLAAHAVVLAICVVLGMLALRRFHRGITPLSSHSSRAARAA
jgi:hypothetical protein